MTATHLLRPVPPRNTIPEIMRLLPDAPRVRQLRHWLGIELTHTFFQNATAMPYGSGDEVDLARAWYFAEASLLAYFTEEDTRAALERIDFRLVRWVQSRRYDGDMFIAETDTDVWVVYRGTEPLDIRDWLVDFQWFKTQVDRGKSRVHQGFYKQFMDLEESGLIGRWLRDNAGQRRVWFTGHSLGGALASYALYHYALSAGKCVDIARTRGCTFGCPLVGNIHFASAVRPHIRRFVYDNDIVPRVPPSRFGYEPAGALTFIDETGSVTETQSGDPDPDLPWISAFTPEDVWISLQTLPELLYQARYGRAFGQLDPFLDHSMAYYIAFIWNQAIRSRNG